MPSPILRGVHGPTRTVAASGSTLRAPTTIHELPGREAGRVTHAGLDTLPLAKTCVHLTATRSREHEKPDAGADRGLH